MILFWQSLRRGRQPAGYGPSGPFWTIAIDDGPAHNTTEQKRNFCFLDLWTIIAGSFPMGFCKNIFTYFSLLRSKGPKKEKRIKRTKAYRLDLCFDNRPSLSRRSNSIFFMARFLA
jgi:hypothetical protein